mmetsp:Transcript_61436/g.139074  ORF Transcript_61436/g.139074 Transcript_61436/m.139074 type:complete len:256 (-) Transcript_61436:611-1378(-)
MSEVVHFKTGGPFIEPTALRNWASRATAFNAGVPQRGIACCLLGYAVVAGLDEGHLGHDGGLHLVPDLDAHLGPLLGQVRAHVAHGDGLLERWGESARGDHPDLFVVHEDLGALPRGGLHPRQPHPLPRRLLQLALRRQEVLRAQKALLCPAPGLGSADGPRQVALDWGGGVVQIVAVQAQPGLESEGVARAEARRFDRGVGEDGLGQFGGLGVGHRELEPVLPGVPAAGQPAAGDARQLRREPHHETHLREIDI